MEYVISTWVYVNVFILVFTVFSYFRIRKKESPISCIPLDIVRPETGDIVAFGQAGMRGRLVKIFSGTVWVHTGLVWRKRGEAYVVELARYDKKTGLQVIPFREWVQLHHFRPLGWLRTYANIREEDFLSVLLKCVDVSINEFLPGIWVKTFFKTERKCKHRTLSCNEFTIRLLQNLGVIEDRYCACCYTAKEIFFGQLPFKREIKPIPYVLDLEKI